ncbi:hypothetical protein [Paenibacillus herberti]|uniref:Uncharacterized protein n=1 Tax=Paenibacillus herberti TaxID=1619309 RepID=A0A229P1B1_9BACL|nr:hypothetical protein [Paenibacillus herberti]OXM15725.1 hypothetical protein CGZ75_03080 [Paenibacillus herberti]
MNLSLVKALRRIGWGLVFVLFDLRLGIVDVLPDAIGYLMVAASLSGRSALHPAFVWASRLGWIMVLLSLGEPFLTIPLTSLEETHPLYIHALGQVFFVCNIIFTMLLCYGFEQLAKQWRSLDILQSIRSRRSLYAFFGVALLIFYPFQFNMGMSEWFFAYMAGATLMALLGFLIMRVPFRLSRVKMSKKGGEIDVYG